MIPPKIVINDNVDKALGEFKGKEFQTFAGSDIKAVMYLPLLTLNSATEKDKPKIKVFADIQTISISSARSVSPVRVLGKSNPIAYTKGAVTYAGTMVFATINQDAFDDVMDVDLAESFANSNTFLTPHVLPPFSVVISASNEKGAAAVQIIHGITITNYGSTYSIDDLYTENTYTYIATDITSLTATSPLTYNNLGVYYKSVTSLVAESMGNVYNGYTQFFNSVKDKGASSFGLNSSRSRG